MKYDTLGRKPGVVQAAILLVISSLTVLVAAILGPNLPDMQAHFGSVPKVEFLVPLSVTAPMLMMAVFCIGTGVLSDRLDRKAMLGWAAVIYALLGTAPLYLNSLHLILGTRIALGILDAVLMTVSTALIANYWHGPKRERYIALQTTVASLSAVFFNALGGALGEVSWRAPFAVYGMSLLLVPLIMIFIWEPKNQYSKSTESLEAHAETSIGDKAFRPGLLVLICLLALVAGLAFMTIPVHFGYLHEKVGVSSPAQIGMAYMVNSSGVFVGSLLLGFFIAQKLKISAQLPLAFILTGVSLCALKYMDSYLPLTTAGFINGIACGILVPTLLTWNIRNLPSTMHGFGTGAFQSCLFLGFFLNPLLIVALDKKLGGRADAVMAFGGVLVLVALAAIIVGILVFHRQRSGMATASTINPIGKS